MVFRFCLKDRVRFLKGCNMIERKKQSYLLVYVFTFSKLYENSKGVFGHPSVS